MLAKINFTRVENYFLYFGIWQRPLVEFSKQVFEAKNQKLDKIWQWYCVKNLRSENHGEQFQNCINDFNLMNI